MTDISLVVTVTRSLLALADLNVNDHVNYVVAPSSFGAQVAWQRTQVSSAYVDGDVTVNRRRANVMEPLVFEVMGTTQVILANNVDALVQAFSQHKFDLKIVIGGVEHTYWCEAADYSMSWVGHRFIAQQLQVIFSVPRHPIPKVGVL